MPCNPQIEFKSLPLLKSSVSGVSDPRASTTVSLFEDFVPSEYRQQLSVGVLNKQNASFSLLSRQDKNIDASRLPCSMGVLMGWVTCLGTGTHTRSNSRVSFAGIIVAPK
jgi:hypothetical protein